MEVKKGYFDQGEFEQHDYDYKDHLLLEFWEMCHIFGKKLLDVPNRVKRIMINDYPSND